MGVALAALLTRLGSTPVHAEYTFGINEYTKAGLGVWAQTWYQHVGKNLGGESLNDYMLRRIYFSFKGEITPLFGFFMHMASDRIGQQGLDRPSLGLGSSIAFRDTWIRLDLSESLKLQLGRMYVPLTRSYGTTSTKTMLTTELPLLQGGVRGSIFYASKVGRDDGLTIWGNPLDGLVQYRFMISEGVEGANNPEDNVRFVGRIALNLLEPEKGWFNKGTYLGKKKVMAVGAGMDYQQDLILNGSHPQDNLAWTVDVFAEHPVGRGTATVEAGYVNIDNGTQAHILSALTAGDDASSWYVQAGYLSPFHLGSGKLQPYLRYETVSVTEKRDTSFYGGGLNWLVRGHDAKVSMDYTFVNQAKETLSQRDHAIATIQLAVGF